MTERQVLSILYRVWAREHAEMADVEALPFDVLPTLAAMTAQPVEEVRRDIAYRQVGFDQFFGATMTTMQRTERDNARELEAA